MVSRSCGRENYLTLQIQEMHVVGAGAVRMGDTETHTKLNATKNKTRLYRVRPQRSSSDI